MLPMPDLRTKNGQLIVVMLDAMVKEAAVVAVVVVVAGVDEAVVVEVVAGNTLVSAVCPADLRCNIISCGVSILIRACAHENARSRVRKSSLVLPPLLLLLLGHATIGSP